MKDTPFLQTLQLKIGAKIMVTFNIDTLDGLTNGARGTLIDIEIMKNAKVSKLVIKFDDPSVGQISRQKHPGYAAKYATCTVIEKIMFQYSLAKKSSLVSNCAKVVQFPVTLCFAATAHKFQGQTVPKPMKLAVDLRSVFEPAQAYVMLSRVQSLEQLFIIEYMPAEKLYASQKALDELKRMEQVSYNNNPTPWFRLGPDSFKVSSLNCRSIRKHIEDLRQDPMINKADVICFSETWLTEEDSGLDLNIGEFQFHFNSVGPGKGLAICFKERRCEVEIIVKDMNLQISKLTHPHFDVIAVYRSTEGCQQKLVEAVRPHQTKPTIVMGDFNLCSIEDNNCVMSKGMHRLGYSQLVTRSTHIRGSILFKLYICINQICLQGEVLTRFSSATLRVLWYHPWNSSPLTIQTMTILD